MKMKKKVYLDQSAVKELRKFTEKVQVEFEAHFRTLRQEGKLVFPESRKIEANLFEIRVKLEGESRAFTRILRRHLSLSCSFSGRRARRRQ